ncbi:MAG: hypothetical protein LBK42_03865 [Propionibacteriaceae bacterium]|nr:hypothetical protein [Propionibacteriaceae bacterium]
MLLALTCLSACSVLSDETAPTTLPTTSIVSAEAKVVDPENVAFSGPWAEEFDRVYRESRTTAGRLALADEKISEAELIELKATYVECLENLGFTNIQIDQNGAMSVDPPLEIVRDPDAVKALVSQCGSQSTDWDAIDALHYQIQGNPDHIDFAVIMAQCLVRVGLKPEGYTADDYKADFSSGVFDDYYDNTKFVSCNDDPAHTV